MTEQTTRIRPIKEWILARHKGLTDIAPDDDLIEKRLVDSLSFVDFVFLIEEVSGTEIDIDNLDLNAVRTLAAIEKSFLTA